MKRFVYYQETDGGLERLVFEGCLSFDLHGWMNKSCEEKDLALLEWALTAEVGEEFEHRMGYCVRLKNTI